MMRLAQRHTPVLLAFVTSLMMSFIMSMVITFINLGVVEDFLLRWLSAWLSAFIIAFPATLLVLPIARRIVTLLTIPPG